MINRVIILAKTYKKSLLILLLFIIIIIIIYNMMNLKKEKQTNEKYNNEEIRAVFVSYIELTSYLKGKDMETSKKNIDKILKNIEDFGFNTIILQVRSASDAIYPSKIYPWSSTVSKEEGQSPGYDILDYFIKKSHQKNLSIYAWLNPYRVRTNENVASITTTNPAYKYIGTDTLFINNGIFYNPAKQEVEDLIVDGIEEIIKNYSIDGLLFDDYFYPDDKIDEQDYQEYIKKNENISLKEYHLMIVNKMVERVHSICKKYHVPFGISPDGNINNNYEKNYADVKVWLSSSKYLDFIMPQIYYGFYNETKSFKKVIDEWNDLITNNKIKLIVALAFYKVGTVDEYAKSGSLEWVTNNNIIMKEIILSRNLSHYAGFALFRYDNLFNSKLYTDTSTMEIENTKKILK